MKRTINHDALKPIVQYVLERILHFRLHLKLTMSSVAVDSVRVNEKRWYRLPVSETNQADTCLGWNSLDS